MALYRYETHLHTKEASACSIISGAEHVRNYKEAGYSGIVVTDHFLNGNSCIPKNLPWEKQIELFCKGYENAKEEGDRIGLSVFFGWEAYFQATEFLIYGLDKKWLLEHPDMLTWSVEEYHRRVHEDGGFVIHAHPFRIRPYIKEVRLFPDTIDAVEVINCGNHDPEFDHKALAYAKSLNLPVTAGTDAHGYESALAGIDFEHKIKDSQDFIESIKAGRYKLIRI
ncbi:PHP domain-containing protein [Mobilitalea sibirica]|uniref:PHP domain-containing protein n=1 Tax=Mobilitalea sibirica TaxID=1462919 RepID=A0A8J7H1P3_9FIRM|nr:PHP domain-containing protein [Mobilitalea sibirica]MBH1940382.1 PHP domain-containing protein [Mobilitalea sibirica]